MSTKIVAVMSQATSAALILLKSHSNDGYLANSPATAIIIIADISIIHLFFIVLLFKCIFF